MPSFDGNPVGKTDHFPGRPAPRKAVWTTLRAKVSTFRVSEDGISRHERGLGDLENGPNFLPRCRQKTLNPTPLGWRFFFTLDHSVLKAFERHPSRKSCQIPGRPLPIGIILSPLRVQLVTFRVPTAANFPWAENRQGGDTPCQYRSLPG